MADEAYTPIPDEEEPLIQTRPRTRRIRYAVGAASLMLAAAARATRPQPQQELFSLSQCPAALAQDLDPSLCAEADAEQCAHLCTEYECKVLCADACDEGAGAVCALAAFANLDTVCAAMGYCAGEVVDDVQAWFAPTWKGYLETASTIKADFEPPWPDWGSGDDDTAMACDVYAWCTVCAGADSCADVESVAATAMHDLYKLPNMCKSRDACLPPHTHGARR
tara:strand:- start:99 stop:767 length:669 start_codon:yes stop_codon:yes gene_type:complete